MPTPEHMTEIVNRYLGAINAGNMEAVMSIYADNAKVEDPVGTEPKTGADILPFYQRAFAGGAKVDLTGPPRVSARAAAFPFHAEIKSVDGAVTHIDVIDIFEFDDDGKVVKMTAHFGPGNVTRSEG